MALLTSRDSPPSGACASHAPAAPGCGRRRGGGLSGMGGGGHRYKLIVKYKTAFYSFYMPVAAGLTLAGLTGDKVRRAALPGARPGNASAIVRGEGRGVSDWYGVRDAACPISTG